MNKVLLVGRISRKTDLKTTSSGIVYMRITVAVTKRNSSAVKPENQADFIPVIAWRNLANSLETYYQVGDLISIEGYFSASSYKNSNDEYVNNNEVVIDNISHLEPLSVRQNRSNNFNSPTMTTGNSNRNNSITANNEPSFYEERQNNQMINNTTTVVNDSDEDDEDVLDWRLDF